MKRKPTLLQKIGRRLQIAYEFIFGLDFLSVDSLDKLGLDGKLSSKCSPSGNKFLRDLIIDLDISEVDSILDIGCGKGSALRVFNDFEFLRTDGIELSEYLGKIAVNNFTILRQGKVNIFIENALEFKSYNNYNYFYLYNPFPEVVFKRLLEVFKNQFIGREIKIIYNNPVCHELLISDGFILLKKYPDMWGNGIHLYSKSY